MQLVALLLPSGSEHSLAAFEHEGCEGSALRALSLAMAEAVQAEDRVSGAVEGTARQWLWTQLLAASRVNEFSEARQASEGVHCGAGSVPVAGVVQAETR